MPNDLIQVLQLVLLLSGGFLLLGQVVFGPAPGTRERKLLLALLAMVGLLSVFSYTKFGKFHDYGANGRQTYHYHDIWHYALGAKYYPELGYDGMYDCTTAALDELRIEGVRVPTIKEVRVLADPMQHYQLAERLPELKEQCPTRFEGERWTEFKADTKVWLDLGWNPRWWQVMLFDLGFNPPPTWNVLAHTTLDVVPLNQTTLTVFPFVDMFLILVVGGGLVWRAWGPFALAGYLVVFGTNYAANYAWTGGSYFRQIWFAALVAGLALLARKHWRWAGVLLALSACLRVFPAVFVAGAGLAMLGAAWRKEVDRKAVIEFTLSGVLTGVVLVGLSLVMFDPSLWVEFFHKIEDHGATYFVWHLGFKKWATWSPAVGGQDFWFGPGLGRFQDWNEMLQMAWAQNRWAYELLRGAMLLGAGALAWRLPPPRAALLFGGTAMFCLTMPANYYYVWLALVPAVWFEERAGWPTVVRLAALFAALATFNMMKWVSGDALVQNSWWNAAMFWFFTTWLLTVAAEQPDLRALLGRWFTHRRKELAAAALATVALVTAVRTIDLDDRKNLVIVLIDTIRADRFGTYGYERKTTPRIDNWAADATVFEHAYAHAPWTAPSVASVMTSLVPRDHGLIDWDMSLDRKHLTLAEHLKGQGYQTMAAISHVVFRPELGFNQGFDRYNTRALQLGHPERAVSSKVVTDVAIQQLKRRARGQPFFLWTHYFDPHFQYVAHQGMTFSTPEEQRGLPRIRQWSNNYDSEVRFTDHHVGRLLDFLEEQGLAEDTVVALVGDHGEEFGDHGGERHSIQLWDEVVRVPLIIRAPGVAPGRYTQALATSDLGPTVLPLMGVPTPKRFAGTPVEGRPDGFHEGGHRPVVLETVRFTDKRGWVRWPWKLIHDREHQKISLYDLERDPSERANRAAQEPAVRDELLNAIREHYEVERAKAPSRDLSEEELEQLRALGYLDDNRE